MLNKTAKKVVNDMTDIVITLDFKQYRIAKKNYEIIAKVYADGTITLHTRQGNREFIFIGSKKETIQAIAELMQIACGLQW